MSSSRRRIIAMASPADAESFGPWVACDDGSIWYLHTYRVLTPNGPGHHTWRHRWVRVPDLPGGRSGPGDGTSDDLDD